MARTIRIQYPGGCRGQSVHMIIFGLRPTFALSRSPAWHEPFAFSIRGRFTM